MIVTTSTLSIPKYFNFKSTVLSHGWCDLPPYASDDNGSFLRTILPIQNRLPVICTIFPGRKQLRLRLESASALSREGIDSVRTVIRSMLRLDEDLSEFYLRVRAVPAYRWMIAHGAGRLLRAPSVFEDAVKTLCTTNCSWHLTRMMIKNLIDHFGIPVENGSSRKAFPMADAIASSSERFLREAIRMGYRAPYLLQFARRTSEGKVNPEEWRTFAKDKFVPTEELYRVISTEKGFGPYAVGNILKLLGRYDELALDSWVRQKFAELHRNGKRATDRTIEKYYKPYGEWRGLVLWLEATQHWCREKFPIELNSDD